VTRRLLLAVAVVGVSALVLVQLEGGTELAVWEAFLVASLIALSRRHRPDRPPSPGSLFGPAQAASPRRPRSLAAVELEVAGATDRALGSSHRLRHRLSALVAHRAGLEGSAGDDALSTVVGPVAGPILADTGAVMSLEEIEAVVDRIERL
jgi:hypothetical protein